MGNIIVPIAGVERFPTDISWFFFSIGLIFWIAPPAVGFIAYVQLMGHEVSGFVLDGFARTLYYFALFLFIPLAAQYRLFFKLPFYLWWWAYSFPLAALTIASALMFNMTNLIFFQWLTYVLLGFLSVVIMTLIIRTSSAMLHKQICVEEG